MHEQPDAAEILRTVARFLQDELLPTLDGGSAYRTRVAINLLEILEREDRLGEAHLARERELLAGILGGDEVDLGAANRALCDRLDDPAGGVDLDREVWPALMEIARAKLAIARPGYDA